METSTLSNETMNITCTDQVLEVRNLSKLVEDLQQQLHESKLQLSRTQCLKDEIELELEKTENQNKLLQQAFQTEKAEIVNSWTERLSKLQAILEEEREQFKSEYTALEEKYEELTKINHEPHVEMPAEFVALKDEQKLNEVMITELKNQLHTTKEVVSDLTCCKAELNERILHLEKELQENKESLKFKSESLKSTLAALEEMKDEKALLSSELALLKAGPVEDLGRGNSLFSEVEDKRHNLEKKFALLHNKYLEAKRILSMKANELEKLKREHIKFQLLWEEDESKLQSSEKKLIESYKKTIRELHHRISELELRPESPQIVTISDKDLSNMDWIHTIIEQARSESRELRQTLRTKAMENLFGEENSHKLISEVTHLKRQCTKYEAVIEELKMKLASLEKSNSLNESSQIQGQKVEQTSNLETEMEQKKNNGKTLRFAADVKENDGVPLKKETKKKEVQFPQILGNSTNRVSS